MIFLGDWCKHSDFIAGFTRYSKKYTNLPFLNDLSIPNALRRVEGRTKTTDDYKRNRVTVEKDP
jgi:hypothetical protein